MEFPTTKRNKVALIGCRNTDAVDLFTMAKCKWLDELILCGEGNERLAERAELLLSIGAWEHKAKIVVGEISDAVSADIAVIGSFVERLNDETSLEHLRAVARAVRSDVRKLVDLGFKGIMINSTTPIDVMTFVAYEESGFLASRVLGLGTPIERGSCLSLNRPQPSIWCTGVSSTSAFLDNCDPVCPQFQNAAHNASVIHKRGFNYSGNRVSGIATCVTSICRAILTNERTTLPVSALLRGEYGISHLFVAVPCVIGRQGIERIVKLPTTVDEKIRMYEYSVELKALISKLGPRIKAAAATVAGKAEGV